MILHALFFGLMVWNIFLFSEGLKPPPGLRPSICLDAHHSVPSTWDRIAPVLEEITDSQEKVGLGLRFYHSGWWFGT